MSRPPYPESRSAGPIVALGTARLLFAGGTVMSLFAALLYAAFPMAASPWREVFGLGCLGLGVFCGIGWKLLKPRDARRGVVLLGWLLTVVVGAAAFGSGEGLHSISLGHIVVAVCMVAVMVGRRPAWVLGGVGLLIVSGLALAEANGLLPPIDHPRPPLVRWLLLLLLIGTGTGVASAIARVIGQHARETTRRGQRFASLMRIAADWYWELDAELRFSTPPQELAGISRLDTRVEFVGRHPWELPFGLSEDELDELRADLEARRAFHGVLVRLAEPEGGGSRFLSLSGEPRHDPRGVFIGYWGVGRNVTDEIRLRRAREVSETRYRELFERSPTALVLHRGGSVLDANAAALQMFGYPDAKAMRGVQMLDHYDVEARALAVQRLQQIESVGVGRTLPAVESRLRTRDGRSFAVRASAARVDASGGPATLSIFSDETERLAAEEASRRSKALLSQVLATSPDLIALTEFTTGRFVLINDSFTRVLGFRSDEAVGRTSTELGTWSHASDRDRLTEAVERDGGVQHMPVRFVAKSGQVVPMLVSAARFDMEGRGYLVINARDVTEAERMRLEREAMFDNASIGIAFTRHERFVQANPRFEQMFGFPTGSLAGQPGSVVWPSAEEYAEIGRTYGPLLAQGRAVEFERPRREAGGAPTWYRVMAKAIDPSHPAAGGTVWICEDITERKRVGEAVEQARDAAESASRAKSAFLANTSHELRTPLNGLLGLARLAQQRDLDPERRQRYVDQIADSAQGLADIMADILDLSKIEAGKLSLETVPFDVRGTVTKLQRAYVELAQARGLQLGLGIADDAPTMVLGDPLRVRQILSNFVNNAIKFTAVGEVRIELQRARPAGVRIAVRDSGPGIDRTTQARLFTPFTQADSSTTRRFGGTGLGLSICRELAEMMDGCVGVDSEPGVGSVFWADLPLPDTDLEDPVTGFGGLEAESLTASRVLVVEDNPVNMLICVALLEQQGVQVAQATNGREAVDAVERAARDGSPFDAVLMDVQMPVMSGTDATRLLRQRWDAVSLPIIALTAAALVSEREQAMASGMNDFLTKPIEPKRLLRALASVISSSRV